MTPIVHLKWGERPPAEDAYLLITRQGRIRGADYYLCSSRLLPDEDPRFLCPDGPGFASLDSALRQAEGMAVRNGVLTIYVKLEGRAAEAPRFA